MLVKEAFNSVVQVADNNSEHHRAMKKVVMRTLGELDNASFGVIPVNLNGSCSIHENAWIEDGDTFAYHSLHDVYINYPLLENSPEQSMGWPRIN